MQNNDDIILEEILEDAAIRDFGGIQQEAEPNEEGMIVENPVHLNGDADTRSNPSMEGSRDGDSSSPYGSNFTNEFNENYGENRNPEEPALSSRNDKDDDTFPASSSTDDNSRSGSPSDIISSSDTITSPAETSIQNIEQNMEEIPSRPACSSRNSDDNVINIDSSSGSQVNPDNPSVNNADQDMETNMEDNTETLALSRKNDEDNDNIPGSSNIHKNESKTEEEKKLEKRLRRKRKRSEMEYRLQLGSSSLSNPNESGTSLTDNIPEMEFQNEKNSSPTLPSLDTDHSNHTGITTD